MVLAKLKNFFWFSVLKSGARIITLLDSVLHFMPLEL